MLAPITYTLTGIALLFLCGFWSASCLIEKRNDPEFWVWVPILGLIVLVLWNSNLNYLGVPAKYSTVAIAIVSAAADALIMRRMGVGARLNWLVWAIVGGCTLLFTLPFVIHGGFPAFNDAVYYAAVADFVRDHSYFAPAEPAGELPWMSQMLFAQRIGARMGAQYFLAGVSALTGADGYSLFIPATACGLFVALCGFWLLARRMLEQKWAPLAALAIYGTNIAFVQQGGSLNWLSQSVVFGPMYALISFGLTTHTLQWRSVLSGGLLVAGMVSIYPEILPFAAVPIVLFTAIQLIREWRSWSNILLFWSAVIVSAFLVNPYTWFYTLRSILVELHGRLGFYFMHLSWWPMDLYFGLASTVGYSNHSLATAARVFGGVLLCVAIAGLFRLKRDYMIVVAGSGAIYAALALEQFYVRQYSYGFHKFLVYSYYLVPLCAGSGIALVLRRRAGMVIPLVWVLFVTIVSYRFVVTCYFWMPYPMPPGLLNAAQTFSTLTDLASASILPKQGERTLILCPSDALDRWVPYFFRKPVGDLFKSGYFSVIYDRQVTRAETFDYYLTLRSQSSWKDESALLLDNALFSLGKAQTAMITTNEGWYEAEGVGAGAPQWMGKKAKTVVVAPTADVISIEARVNLPPDRESRHLHVTMNGQDAGTFLIDKAETQLVIPDLKVQPGLNDLIYETEQGVRPSREDARLLSLRFNGMHIQADAPSSLNLFRPFDEKFVSGLTPDRWITSSGVQVGFHRPDSGNAVLEIAGEAISASVPGAIEISSEGSAAVRIPVLKAGPFRASTPIPTSSKTTRVVVTITTEHTFRPADAKTSKDTRELGFRLESLRLKAE